MMFQFTIGIQNYHDPNLEFNVTFIALSYLFIPSTFILPFIKACHIKILEAFVLALQNINLRCNFTPPQ